MTLVTINSWIAGVICLVAIGSIRCMNGVTPHAVRAGIVMIMAGAGGQALGFLAGAWDHYLDTLLYGGLLTLLLANRRAPACIPAAASQRLALLCCAGTTALIGVYVTLNL